MKKMMTKRISIFIIFALIIAFAITVVPDRAFAEADTSSIVLTEKSGDITSGVFRDVDWRIDSEGVLIIGKQGETQRFSYEANSSTLGKGYYPWWDYRESISGLRFEGTVEGNGNMGWFLVECENLTSIDFTGFDTSDVTDMNRMFLACRSLKSIDFSGLDTSNVKDMSWMLSQCDNLESVDLSVLDTSSVEDLSNLFFLSSALTGIDLTGIDTSCVTDMGGMFHGCSALTQIDLSPLDTGNVTDMGSMFYDCRGLAEIDLSTFDTGNVTDMRSMFRGCTGLTSFKPEIDTSSVTSMVTMFAGCTGLTEIDLSEFNTGNVETMWSMFAGCTSLTNLDLSSFDTTNVTSMRSMFEECSGLTEIKLSSFNTANVTDMWTMFEGCSALTSLDLSSFDISSAGKLYNMLNNCSSLQEMVLGNWHYAADAGSTGSRPYFPVDMYDVDDDYELYNTGAVLPECTNHTFVREKPETKITEADGDFYIGKSGGNDLHLDTGHGYRYRDTYFTAKTASEYNHSLATMSLCLAFSTYRGNYPYKDGDHNIKKILQECGFTGDDFQRYEQYGLREKPSTSGIGCAIGSKGLEDSSTLIVVAVRSGDYEAEWASNFEVGLSGDHSGFSKAAGMVYDDIGDYISKHGITGDVKIWITGYSRGGAVATQTAARLNKGSFENISYTKNDVYAYGFATPAGAVSSSNPGSTDYSNIFNIIHYHDIVPLVAPEKWGFGRYGTTLILPYSALSHSYDPYEKRMKEYLSEMGASYRLDEFRTFLYSGDSVGTFSRRFIDSFAKNICLLGQSGTGRALYNTELQQQIIALFKGGSVNTAYGIWGIAHDPTGRNLLVKQAGLNPVLTFRAAENIELLYLAWMQVMDENYGADFKPVFSVGNARYIRVNCPVDIKVYDSNNSQAASIINEEPGTPSDYIETFIDENGQKTVMLPADEDYRVEVEPREKCDVSISIEEAAGVSSEPVRVVNYELNDVTKGDSIVADVTAFNGTEVEESLPEGSSAEYSLSLNNTELEHVSEYRGNDVIDEHTYTVSMQYNEDMGTAYGAGEYIEGEFAQLSAECKDGYEFEGFYVGDNRLTDDDSENNPFTVRVKVTENKDITARFRKRSQDIDEHTYTVSMQYNEEMGNAYGAGEYIEGEFAQLSAKCKEGYEFEGFYAGNNKLSDDDPDNNPLTVRIKVTENMAITARFRKHSHSYGDWQTIKTASELESGMRTRSCSVCGNAQTETVAQLAPSLPKVRISKPKAAKKSMTIKWKKVPKKKLKKIRKIQIQYSTDKSFDENVKSVTVSAKKTSRTIKGLKPKKKYFIRIRAVNGNHISAWSGVKSVKVK